MIRLDDLLSIPSTDMPDIANARNRLRITVPNLRNKVNDSHHKWVMEMTDHCCCPRWKSDHGDPSPSAIVSETISAVRRPFTPSIA